VIYLIVLFIHMLYLFSTLFIYLFFLIFFIYIFVYQVIISSFTKGLRGEI